jgi:PAS domain S-box-containing protein
MVALLPALGFHVYAESEARRVRHKTVEDEALRTVRLVNSEQQRIIEGAEQVLNAFGAAPSVEDLEPERCSRMLRGLLRASPRYNAAAVIGLDGHPVCASFPLERSIDVSDRTYFRLTLATGDFVIGDYSEGRTPELRSIEMAKPLINQDGAVTGVIVVALSLEWLGQQLKNLPLPPGASASVRDRNGVLLARYPDAPGFVGSAMPPAKLSTLQGNEYGVADMSGIDGVRRLVAYAPLSAGRNGLRVAVGLDRNLAFAAVTQANQIGLVLIIGGIGLALAMTVLLGTRLIRRPVNRLLEVAERWRTGDLAARTGLRQDAGEFGRLAVAFDRMAAAQEDREKSLRRSERHFRAIFEREAGASIKAATPAPRHDVRDEMLRALGEATPDHLYVKDRAGRLLYANPACLAAIGRQADEVIGYTEADFGGDRTAAEAVMTDERRIIGRGETETIEECAWDAGRGEVRVRQSTKTPLHDPGIGEVIGLVGISRDVTEQRRAAEALAESQARFAAMVDAIPTMVWESDPSGSITWVSESWHRYCGVPTADLLGSDWSAIVHPDELAEGQTRWREAMRTGEGYVRRRRIRRASDGAWRWHLTQGEPVRGAGGKIIRWLGSMTDVHDLVQAEAALQEREEILRLFVERAPAAIAMFDNEMRYLGASRRFLADYGLSMDPAAVLGRSHYDLFPEIPERWRDVHRRVLAGETIAAEDEPFLRADGHTDWVRWEMTSWHRADGSVGGAMLFSEVVTARKQAEEALRESEARLRLVQQVGGIASTDRTFPDDAVILSEEFVRLWGLPPGQTRASPAELLSLVHPDDRDRVATENRAAFEKGGIFTTEYRLQLNDKSVRWINQRYEVFCGQYGKPLRVVTAQQDITERRQAEDALHHAIALLGSIGRCSPDPIYAKDADGRFLFANSATLAIIGKTADEVIGRTDADFLDDPMQAAAVMANDRHIIETGGVERFEETFNAAGLGPRIFRSAKAPLLAENGSVIGVVGVGSDVTQIKADEAELWRLTVDLEARVREEIVARVAAQVSAAHAERLRALGQLAGGIAHDFNNVLQGIEGVAMLIDRRPGDQTAVRRHARRVLESVDRGASITRRLLAFGHRSDLRAEVLDAASLLNGLREMLAHTLGAAIHVHVRLGDDLPPLSADKGQLQTALVNLATNARDAMPDGGQLIFSAEPETVPLVGSGHTAWLAPGRYVRLVVADSGKGMDTATLTRVCEPFFTTKEPGIGTGLGLAMAKGFAEQSGGALSVESNPGRGTTVTLWLPAADSETSPDSAVESEEATGIAASGPGMPTRSSGRLMVVDDEAVIREVLAEHLEDAGFGVLTAGNGAEALALLAGGEAVDALITDLSMPGMDGIAVIRAAQERWPGLPAVLLTGYAGDDISLAVGGAVTGTFSLLRKPVRIHDLVDRVQALLASAVNRSH